MVGLVLGVVVGAAVMPGVARGETVCGTLLTNVVTATMHSGAPDFIVYEVSYNATATVLVLCSPVVRLLKNVVYADGSLPDLACCGRERGGAMAAVGATVTFQVCIQNEMTDSAWWVTITDALPANVSYQGMVSGWGGGAYEVSDGVPGMTYAYNTGGAWSDFTPPGGPAVGTVSPLNLRWVVQYIGPRRSACVAYAAKVL